METPIYRFNSVKKIIVELNYYYIIPNTWSYLIVYYENYLCEIAELETI